jgi:hypothetical protein
VSSPNRPIHGPRRGVDYTRGRKRNSLGRSWPETPVFFAASHLAIFGGALGEIVDFESTFLLCYVRGPEGLIVELAERLDGAPG